MEETSNQLNTIIFNNPVEEAAASLLLLKITDKKERCEALQFINDDAPDSIKFKKQLIKQCNYVGPNGKMYGACSLHKRYKKKCPYDCYNRIKLSLVCEIIEKKIGFVGRIKSRKLKLDQYMKRNVKNAAEIDIMNLQEQSNMLVNNDTKDDNLSSIDYSNFRRTN